MPDQPALVIRTALAWARAAGLPTVHFAYVDPGRYVVAELPGGQVRHAPLDPDNLGESWEQRRDLLVTRVQAMGADVDIVFHYLAGDPAGALGWLAAKVRASVIVTGTREHGVAAALDELVHGSVAVELSHRQSVPVLMVPLAGERRMDVHKPEGRQHA
ncbi:MAG: universal stress protein [Pseudoclavibacter sp.]